MASPMKERMMRTTNITALSILAAAAFALTSPAQAALSNELVLGGSATPATLTGVAGLSVNDFGALSFTAFSSSGTSPAITTQFGSAFDYYYTFSIDKNSSLTYKGSYSNVDISGKLYLDNTSAGYGSGGVKVTQTSAISNPSTSSDTIVFANLNPGTYTVHLFGDLTSAAKIAASYGSVTSTISVSAVPIPGALLLFGSGLLGLAGFGVKHRRKTS